MRFLYLIDYYSKKQKENVQVVYKEDNKIIKRNLSITIVKGSYNQNESNKSLKR